MLRQISEFSSDFSSQLSKIFSKIVTLRQNRNVKAPGSAPGRHCSIIILCIDGNAGYSISATVETYKWLTIFWEIFENCQLKHYSKKI